MNGDAFQTLAGPLFQTAVASLMVVYVIHLLRRAGR